MRSTSEGYKRLLADPRHVKEYRVTIGSETYYNDRIVSLETYGGLFERESLCIGSAVSREADMAVRAPGNVPYGGRAACEYRLALGDEASEWVPKGVFFIDTRETDSQTGVLTLHCFDAMLKADRPWKPDPDIEFPLPMPEAARILAGLIGVDLDPRTKLNPAYTIDHPASDPESETGDYYKIRQILRWIATAHGGNWTITEDGKLLLVRLRSRAKTEETVLGTEDGDAIDFGDVLLRLDNGSDGEADGDGMGQTDVGRSAAGASFPGTLPPVSKVILDVDDEYSIAAGDDSGQTLEADCPYATQAMADALLEQLRGYEYQPAEIADALIDPAAELGDAVTAAGVTFTVAQMDTIFDGLMASDISAPGQRDSEHELGIYTGPQTDKDKRKWALIHSEIDKKADELRLFVENRVTGAIAEIDISLQAILQRISDGEAKTAEIETKVDGIRLEVANEAGADGQVYARITIKIGPNSYSGYIKLEGNVDVSGQLSADALYAAMGDIADLTVDRLSTSRRIVKYLKKDTSDDNYVRVYDQFVEFVTGTTAGGTEQAVNPSGMPIYWEDDPAGASLGANGYPYKNGERIFTTTAQTQWPVTVYTYTEQVKRSIGFEDIDGTYTPVDTFGAGNPQGRHKSRLAKGADGLELMHLSDKGDIGFVAGDEGYLDLYGLRKTTALDFSGWDGGRFTETVEGGETYSYGVEFDAEGRPVRITTDEGFEMAVTW